MEGSGHWFDDVRAGDSFARTATITEATLAAAIGLLGDWNPLHSDEVFARKSRFGGRILHGMMTSALMGGPVGMYFYGTAIAYLEHNARFLAPVRPGDTLTIRWIVTAVTPKPKIDGGIVAMRGSATNQDGVVTVETSGTIMVHNRPRPA